MRRLLPKPSLRARRYIRAARSVTTSGRFKRPESPLSWLIARDRFLAIEDPAEARSWVRLSRQSWSLSSALRFRFEAWALEIIVDRFLSNAAIRITRSFSWRRRIR